MTTQNIRPNILLLYPDQHRGDWMPYRKDIMEGMGMTPLPLRMPNIEKIMKHGTTFTKCISSSPLCAPARACLASGLRYHNCGVGSNADDYPLDQKTFYSVLKSEGYNVGGVGKFDLHKPTHWWGLEGWIDDLGTMGFTHGIDNAGKIDAIVSGVEKPKDPYMSFLYKKGLAKTHIEDMFGRKNKTHPTSLPEEAYCDNWISRNAVDMINGFEPDKPWFIQVNFTGPHPPWDVTSEMRRAWSDVEFPMPNEWDGSQPNIQEIRQNYAAMLENIDRNIGEILDTLRERGDLENTLIIYSSDHGEMLGDFGKFHKSKPQRGSVHIPLVVSGPGVKRNVYSEALVETQDLALTIVDYAQSVMPEARDARSLKGILEGTSNEFRKVQISAYGPWTMIAQNDHKLILWEDGREELYNIVVDPWEKVDVIANELSIADGLRNHIKEINGSEL